MPLPKRVRSAAPTAESELGYEYWQNLPPEIKAHIPVADAWGLHPDTAYEKWRQAAFARKRLAERLLDTRNSNLAEERARFKRAIWSDPIRFFSNVIWTKDPEAPWGRPKELPFVPFQYVLDQWIGPWYTNLRKRRTRTIHRKTRRVMFSISLMGFEYFCWRTLPGYKAWVSSYRDDKVDNLDSWDSLFAKLRFFHRKAREFYPWLFPDMPSSSDVNKKYIWAFPEWSMEGHKIDQACWGNELLGIVPTDLAGARAGGYLRGTADEVAWYEAPKGLIEAADPATPHLGMGSTPKDPQNYFSVRSRERTESVLVTETHWTHNPLQSQGIYWDPDDEWGMRPGMTKGWRTKLYVQILEENRADLTVVARNHDLAEQATSGGKVFLTWSASSNISEKEDLYDPEWPLYVWYDVGYGDPWAFWWVQISDATHEILIVDYYMKAGVGPDFFIPMIQGWNFDQQAQWRAAPSRKLFLEQFPNYRYSLQEEEIIRRWYGRRRPRYLVGDHSGKQRHGGQRSVEQTWQDYGMFSLSSSPAHHMNDWILHANACIPRMQLSKRLVGLRPERSWPSADEIFEYWSRMESTEAGREAKPLHDDYSHGGTAIVYGCQHLPHSPQGAVDPKTGDRVVADRRIQVHTVLKERRDPHTGWL